MLDCDLSGFRAALVRENHTLKRALTDPRLFSGIGNAYSDEILHRARLSPVALTQRLTDEAVERLFAASQAILREWVERLRAETGKDFRKRLRRFVRECQFMGASRSLARFAAQPFSASRTPKTRRTIALAARPEESSWPTGHFRACSKPIGPVRSKKWRIEKRPPRGDSIVLEEGAGRRVELKNDLQVSEEDCSSWRSETQEPVRTGKERFELQQHCLSVFGWLMSPSPFCLDFILANTKNEDSHKTTLGMRIQRRDFLDRCETFRLSRPSLICSGETVVGKRHSKFNSISTRG